MKKLIGFLTGFLLLLSLAGLSHATTWTDNETYPHLGAYINYENSLEQELDLNSGGNILTSAFLELWVTDDDDLGNIEKWTVEIGANNELISSFDMNAALDNFGSLYSKMDLTGTALSMLNVGAGKETFWVRLAENTFGDFRVNEISLTGTDAVPEPATMMLFGLGLLGFAGVSRRKK